ncbi:hypothetical protein D9M71_125150 [compost metagenome]
MWQIPISILLILASQVSLAEQTASTSSGFSTNHAEELLSTSNALTKISLLIQSYRCEAATKEEEKVKRCASAKAVQKIIETLGSSESLRQDTINLIASEGESKTLNTEQLTAAARKSNLEYFKGMSDAQVSLFIFDDLTYSMYK